jgi:uncharacterized protein (DUF305 family)
MSLQVEPEAEWTVAPDEPRGGPTWMHAIVIALLAAFVAGAIGYVLGQGRPPSEDSVDVGFLRDMIDHHEQAVAMARITTRAEGIDPSTRSSAEEVMLLQQREVGLMDAQLDAWGRIRGDLDRTAMQWMDMGTSVADMPGMQTDEALDELAAASGREADRLFFTMMREHHIGGVHMAEYAAEHAGSSRVRELASRMARFQTTEVVEYGMLMRQMGLE